MKLKSLLLILIVILGSCKKEETSEQSYKLDGYAQKGPFIVGANVTIIELNEKLTPTGKSYSSVIDDNTGHFSFPNVKFDSKFVQLKVEGQCYDEVVGGIPYEQLTMFSIVDLSKDSSININILTHLEQGRILNLVSSGITFENAKKQAHAEILKIFNMNDLSVGNAERLNLTSPTLEGGVLLLISSIIQSNIGSGMTFQEYITNLATDFKDNGIIDSEILKKALETSALSLNLSRVKENLLKHYEELGEKVQLYEMNALLKRYLTSSTFENPFATVFPTTLDNAFNLIMLDDSTIIDKNKTYCIAINDNGNNGFSNIAIFLSSSSMSNFTTSNISWFLDSDGKTLRYSKIMNENKNHISNTNNIMS